jgi:hypothetical protein
LEYPEEKPPVHITPKSIEHAVVRNKRIIQGVIGARQIIGERAIGIILRRFTITGPEEQNFRDAVRVENEGYSAERIRELLFSAANEAGARGLAGRIRPVVLAALANLQGTVLCPRREVE